MGHPDLVVDYQLDEQLPLVWQPYIEVKHAVECGVLPRFDVNRLDGKRWR